MFALSSELQTFAQSLEKALQKVEAPKGISRQAGAAVHALMKSMDLHGLIPVEDRTVDWSGEIMVACSLLGGKSANHEFFESVVLCGELLRRSALLPHQCSWLEQLQGGRLTLSLAARSAGDGKKIYAGFDVERGVFRLASEGCIAPLFPGAQMLLFPGEAADGERRIFAIDARQVELDPLQSLDGQTWARVRNRCLNVQEENTVLLGHGTAPAMDRAFGLARLAISAEALGISERLFKLCVDHLSLRRQFGSTLSSNQSLRHRMADMKISIELMRSMVQWAANPLSRDDKGQVSSAVNCFVDTRAREISEMAIQLHGGMGMTEECGIGVHARRLLLLGQRFGSGLGALQRLAHELQEVEWP